MLQKVFRSLIALTIMLISFFLPIRFQGNQFELTSKDSSTFHLSMLNDRRFDFRVTFPCEIGLTQPTWILEFFGGPALRIEAMPKSIILLVGHQDKSRLKVITFKRYQQRGNSICIEEIFYSQVKQSFSYTSNGLQEIEKITIPYEVQINRVIKINTEFPQNNIDIIVYSTAELSQNIYFKFNLIIITILFFMYIYRDKIYVKLNRYPKIETSAKVLLIISSLTILSLITLPRGDDGWYQLMNKYFNLTKIYDNYVFPSPRPSGYIHNYINSFLSQNNTILSTRVLSIIFTILIYIFIWLISKRQSSSNLGNSIYTFVIIFTSILLLFTASLNSLRPEAVIAFLYILILYLLMTMHKDNLFFYTAVIIALIGLGLSTHQQATILLFAALPIFLKIRNYGLKFTFDNVFALLLGSSIAVQFIFINGNIFWLFNTINRFTEAANIASPGRFLNNYPLYAEWIRPYHLYSSGLSTQPQIFMGTLLFVSSIFLIFTASKLFKSPNLKYSPVHFLALSAGLAPLGLLLSPIKWSWYYAPLYLNILLSYLILNNSGVYKNSIKKVYGQIIVVGFSAALAFTYNWRPNDFNWPLRSISIEDLNTNYWFIFGSLQSGAIWLIITALVLLAVYLLRHRNIEFISRINSIFIIFIISLLGFIHITPPVADAIKNPNKWTFVKQSVVGLWDKDVRCGLASTIKDEKTGKPIQQLLDENNWSVVSMPAPYIFIPCTKPVSTEAGSWLMPDVGFGWVPVYDQQRLATMTDITILGCDETLNTEDSAQRCFYKWDTDIKNLPPYKSTVVSYPDYSQLSEKLNPFN
jgi:hypothetical protein